MGTWDLDSRFHCCSGSRYSHVEFLIRLGIGPIFKTPSWIWKTIEFIVLETIAYCLSRLLIGYRSYDRPNSSFGNLYFRGKNQPILFFEPEIIGRFLGAGPFKKKETAVLLFILSLVLICYSCMNKHICSKRNFFTEELIRDIYIASHQEGLM